MLGSYLKKMIEILPYAQEHHSGVVDVILPIQQTEFKIPITLDGQPDLLDIPGSYRKGKGNFWVAMHGSEIVGTIALIDIENHQGALRKMFVKPSFRGSHLRTANRLLEVLLDWCETHMFREIYLGTTPKFLAAHRFYEKNHFLEIQKHELPDSFPVMVVDTKFYMLTISSEKAQQVHEVGS